MEHAAGNLVLAKVRLQVSDVIGERDAPILMEHAVGHLVLLEARLQGADAIGERDVPIV